jgi:hypothetical protein
MNSSSDYFSTLPQTFFNLFHEIGRSYFRHFFKNTLKALIATAIAVFTPELMAWLESENLLNPTLLSMLQDFIISPENMLKGCLLSSLGILTTFSFIEKLWFVGIFKGIWRFLSGIFSWLNLFRNSATTAFAWGLASGFILGWWLENPLVTLTLFFSAFLAGTIPECSAVIYFARFFWNRFYQTTVLNSGLKPADEFLRGTSPGLMAAIFFKATEATGNSYIGLFVFICVLFLFGFIRQRNGKINEK